MLGLPLVFTCQEKIEGSENMVQAPPKPIGPEINIELEDLQELARINPLAWEQLLHIAANRQKDARIADLEAHLEQAHKYGQARNESTVTEHRLITKGELDNSVRSNGLSHVS